MNQQPDKLFREKLEGYNRHAPVSAWDKIDTGLQKKGNKSLVWKIAASLLLLAVATYVLWPTTEQQQNQIATKQSTNNKNVKKKAEVQQPLITTGEKPVSVAQSPVIQKENIIEKPKSKREQPKEKIFQDQIQEEILPMIDDNDVAVETEVEITAHLPMEEIKSSEAVVVNPPIPDHTVTLVFSAREADEYLDKTEIAEATSIEKKPSTLRKLLKKAGDLKNNQDPFGELRQKKNEILALNFRTEKQRGQNE